MSIWVVEGCRKSWEPLVTKQEVDTKTVNLLQYINLIMSDAGKL